MKTQPEAPVQEPLFWYKPYPNGMYNGPVHNAQIGDVLRGSEEWRPLYTTPPAAQQDIQRLSALVRAQQITIDKLEAAQPAPVQEPVGKVIASVPHLRSISVELLPEAPVPSEDSLLYTTPPAAQRQCNWPTCQSEEYQQALAEQINQELVTGAAQRQWVGLTEWEVIEMKAVIAGTLDVQFINFARAIEAKLKAINGFHSTEKDT